MEISGRRLVEFVSGFVALFLLCSIHFAILNRGDNLVVQRRIFEKRSPTLLVLGDSRAAMDVDVGRLGPSAATLAYPGANWREMVVKARWAIDSKPGIRAVIVPADDHMFSGYRSHDDDLFEELAFSGTYGTLRELYPSPLFPLRYAKAWLTYRLPLLYGPSWSGYRVLWFDAMASRLFGYRPRKHIEVDEHGSLFYPDGKRFSDADVASRRSAAAARAAEQFQPPIVHTALVEAFDEFLRLCEARGIQVIAVRFPLTAELLDATEPVDRADVDRIYSERIPRFGRFLDFGALLQERPELFHDEDHLNREGAGVFTSLLDRELTSLRSGSR